MRLVLSGPRVTLRPFRVEELDALWAVREREQGSMTYPHGSLGTRERLERRLERSGELTESEIFLAVETEGRLVGEIQARRADGFVPPGVFELGIELFEPPDRGRGLGAEAIALLTDHLFEKRLVHRLQATTDVDNRPMRRVLERMGFPYEGLLRGFMPTGDGAPRDYALYGLTQDDWRNVRHGWTLPS